MAEAYVVERRKFALEKAIETHKSYNRTVEQVIETAKVFEAYLNGKEV